MYALRQNYPKGFENTHLSKKNNYLHPDTTVYIGSLIHSYIYYELVDFFFLHLLNELVNVKCQQIQQNIEEK